MATILSRPQCVKYIENVSTWEWRLSTMEHLKSMVISLQTLNSLRPRQNGRHFADDFFKRIFLNENVWISIKISLRFVPKGPIYNIPAFVQIMAWRRPSDKPLSETMMDNLPTHICVSRPQWVNKQPCSPPKSDVYWWFRARLQYLQCISSGDTAVLH